LKAKKRRRLPYHLGKTITCVVCGATVHLHGPGINARKTCSATCKDALKQRRERAQRRTRGQRERVLIKAMRRLLKKHNISISETLGGADAPPYSI
jgi:predicted nucleic acid-binding Zn ribbon protein